jgi:hypothetical protein
MPDAQSYRVKDVSLETSKKHFYNVHFLKGEWFKQTTDNQEVVDLNPGKVYCVACNHGHIKVLETGRKYVNGWVF